MLEHGKVFWEHGGPGARVHSLGQESRPGCTGTGVERLEETSVHLSAWQLSTGLCPSWPSSVEQPSTRVPAPRRPNFDEDMPRVPDHFTSSPKESQTMTTMNSNHLNRQFFSDVNMWSISINSMDSFPARAESASRPHPLFCELRGANGPGEARQKVEGRPAGAHLGHHHIHLHAKQGLRPLMRFHKSRGP